MSQKEATDESLMLVRLRKKLLWVSGPITEREPLNAPRVQDWSCDGNDKRCTCMRDYTSITSLVCCHAYSFGKKERPIHFEKVKT